MIKKFLPWFIALIFITLIILAISMKNNMNHYISEMMKKQASVKDVKAGAAFADSAFNYIKNSADYQLTFLEFGAEGCPTCRRMEKVMAKVEEDYVEVNFVFINVLLPRYQSLIKYYGIATIPTQVLLDNHGNEFFRHHGYYSYGKIVAEFEKNK